MVSGLSYVQKIAFVAFRSTVFPIPLCSSTLERKKNCGTLTKRQCVISISLRLISSFLVSNLSSRANESASQQNHSMMEKKKKKNRKKREKRLFEYLKSLWSTELSQHSYHSEIRCWYLNIPVLRAMERLSLLPNAFPSLFLPPSVPHPLLP